MCALTVETSGTYVNVGCGLIAPPGWINLDSSFSALLGRYPVIERLTRRATGLNKAAWPPGIRRWDARRGLPFGDETVDGVYASHFLEHLTRWHAEAFLAECERVLRRGGVLRVVVPDLESIVADYVRAAASGRTALDADRFLEALACCPSPDRSAWPIRMLRSWKQFNVHKWMYDEASLCARLRAAGFVGVGRRGCMNSEMPQVRNVEREISFVHGLCVEGRKP